MKRNTIQRALILETVRSMVNHPTAEQVYERIHPDHPTISKGTVYRNLNDLAESGEIALREVPGAASRYDRNTDPHYHAKCLRCGEIYDVDMDQVPDLMSLIRGPHGFQFTGYDVTFRGICPECAGSEGPDKT